MISILAMSPAQISVADRDALFRVSTWDFWEIVFPLSRWLFNPQSENGRVANAARAAVRSIVTIAWLPQAFAKWHQLTPLLPSHLRLREADGHT
jgi:hypothetical protein